jgi:hypothetical protein
MPGPLSDEIVSGKFIKTVSEWVDGHAAELNFLAGHLEAPEEDVILDMLEDIISVWVDAHNGNDPEDCPECFDDKPEEEQ